MIFTETPTTPRYPIFKPDTVPFITGSEIYTETRISGYTPQMIKTAYGFGSDIDCTGMKIAVVEAYKNTNIQNDINMFSREFGLPNVTLDIHYPDGMSEFSTRRWILESSLDTQWIHALCTGAEISVVFAKNENMDSMFSAMRYAANLGADVVSMSFGTPEFVSQGEISSFMNSSDSIFVAAAGDVGGMVFFPSSSPYVLSVGGTKLTLLENGMRVYEETAWSFGGGGPSKYAKIPPWQLVFADIEEMTKGFRATPDTAFSASSSPGAAVYITQLENTATAGWTTASGTSFGAAAFAAIVAGLLKKKPSSLSGKNVQRYLYALAGGTKYDLPQYYFNDITLGNNVRYSAKIGWDFCTGLGSPRVRQILQG